MRSIAIIALFGAVASIHLKEEPEVVKTPEYKPLGPSDLTFVEGKANATAVVAA